LTTLIAFGVSAAFLLSLVPDGRNASAAAGYVGRLPQAEPAVTERRDAPLAPAAGPAAEARRQAGVIAVEKDGRAREICIEDIYAVRANAHYTYVHDGEQEYFCPLTIGAIEARLDPQRFLRVHRSHIVAINRVASLKKAGENGVAELAAPVRCTIPVARSHFRQVKQMVEARLA